MNHTYSLLRTLYSSTADKYIKFKTRLDKARQSGKFFTLSKSKQHSLVQRLQRLYEKLKSLQTQLRVSGIGAAIALAISAGTAEAQTYGPFQFNEAENPLPAPYRVNRAKPAAVDIDNDGDLDVFAGDKYGNIRFFRNVGNETTLRRFFEDDENNPLASFGAGNWAAPAFSDVDNDGDFDVLIGTRFGETFFFRNTGSATEPLFTQQTGSSNPFDGITGTYGYNGDGPTAPTFVDIDNDSDLDLIIGTDGQQVDKYNHAPAIKVYANNSGTFTPADDDDFSPLFYYEGLKPVFADIDVDGDLDIIAGTSGGLRTFINNGTDAAPEYEPQSGVWNPDTHRGNPFSNAYLYGNLAPLLADFDGDNDLDVLVGIGYNTTIVYLENTDGDFSLERLYGLNLNPFDGVDVGDEATPSFSDIDGDGDLDAILGSKYDFELRIFINDNGWFVYDPENPLSAIETSERALPVFVDIDDDGDQDVFISNKEEIIFLKNNNNAFTEEASPLVIPGAFSNISTAFNDVDSDGDFDAFVFNHSEDAVEFFRNTGTAQNPAFTQQTAPEPFDDVAFTNYVTKLRSVDVDHDGDLDLVVSHSTIGKYYLTYFTLFENNGDETFSDQGGFLNQVIDEEPEQITTDIYSIVSMSDVDNDGDLDLVIGKGNGRIEYYENVNPAPVTTVSLNMVSVTLNTPAILDPDLTIDDDDGDEIVQATVTISNYREGNETLDFSAGESGLTGEFEDGVLTIRGKASRDTYETVLKTVSYEFSGNVTSTARIEARTAAGVPPQKIVKFNVRDIDFTEALISQVDVIQLDLIGEPGAEIVVYNAISPGVSSGANDYIRIVGLPADNKVSIFNRWGDKVYEVSGYDNVDRRFEGKSDSGKDLPTGTYYYIIELKNRKVNGYLSLRR